MTLITVPTPEGARVSIARLVGVVISLLGAARLVGALTGKFHIPTSAEDTVQAAGNQLGEAIASLLLMLNGLGIWGIRRAIN